MLGGCLQRLSLMHRSVLHTPQLHCASHAWPQPWHFVFAVPLLRGAASPSAKAPPPISRAARAEHNRAAVICCMTVGAAGALPGTLAACSATQLRVPGRRG